jgi:hypothetical protein
LGPWALDSGGFSELTINGYWPISPQEYVDFVRRCQDEIGNLDFAATMDWMCEPIIREGGKAAGGIEVKGTGKSVKEHQRLTVENVLELMSLAPELPWVPVLQGWEISEYYEHYDMYEAAGVDLVNDFPALGIGSVCRRGHTDEVEKMMIDLSRADLKLHGFGFKVKGLRRVSDYMHSADSMAWSYQARRRDPLPECVERAEQGLERGHKNCANCMRYALMWRENTLNSVHDKNTARTNGRSAMAKKKTSKKKAKKTTALAKREPIEPEIVDRIDEVLMRVDAILVDIGEQYYELGQHLYEVENGEYYSKLGFASFEEYCEIRLNFGRTKAKNCIRMWEVLDQKLRIPWEAEDTKKLQVKGIPWTNIRVVMPMIAPRGKDVISKGEARRWLLRAKKHARNELAVLVKQERAKQQGKEPSGERAAKSGEIQEANMDAELEAAAATETPYVEEIPTGVEDIVADGVDLGENDSTKVYASEVDGIDPETGEEIRLMRVTYMLTRDEFSHVKAAHERMGQITGIAHPGKQLDLMAAEINETLADAAAGGAAHRLDWYVKNLERIFDVELECTVPPNSRLRQMSRV